MDEEKMFKDRLRAGVRRIGNVLFLIGFIFAVFLASIQCLFRLGPRPEVYWIPMGLYVGMAAMFLWKGRWVLALWCLAGVMMLASVYPKALALKTRDTSAASSNK